MMRRFLIELAVGGAISFLVGAGAVLVAAKAITGSWCPKCEVIEMTESLREVSERRMLHQPRRPAFQTIERMTP